MPGAQHVALQERLLRLGPERDVEGPARARQSHHEHLQLGQRPAITAWNSPKSTSASAPGTWDCAHYLGVVQAQLGAAAGDIPRHVTSAIVAPCSATSRCQSPPESQFCADRDMFYRAADVNQAVRGRRWDQCSFPSVGEQPRLPLLSSNAKGDLQEAA